MTISTNKFEPFQMHEGISEKSNKESLSNSSFRTCSRGSLGTPVPLAAVLLKRAP